MIAELAEYMNGWRINQLSGLIDFCNLLSRMTIQISDAVRGKVIDVMTQINSLKLSKSIECSVSYKVMNKGFRITLQKAFE
jgi:CRISPR/Cas system-associated exonuclease Cas4 (RecB family)